MLSWTRVGIGEGKLSVWWWIHLYDLLLQERTLLLSKRRIEDQLGYSLPLPLRQNKLLLLEEEVDQAPLLLKLLPSDQADFLLPLLRLNSLFLRL